MASCGHVNSAWRHFGKVQLDLCARCYVVVTQEHDKVLREREKRIAALEAEIAELRADLEWAIERGICAGPIYIAGAFGPPHTDVHRHDGTTVGTREAVRRARRGE